MLHEILILFYLQQFVIYLNFLIFFLICKNVNTFETVSPLLHSLLGRQKLFLFPHYSNLLTLTTSAHTVICISTLVFV